MKKPLLIAKALTALLLFPLLTLLLAIGLQGGKNILDALYLWFPLLFLLQGLLLSKPWLLALGWTVHGIAFLLPVNLLYHMGSCIDLFAVYLLLSLAAFGIKRYILHKKKRSQKTSS